MDNVWQVNYNGSNQYVFNTEAHPLKVSKLEEQHPASADGYVDRLRDLRYSQIRDAYMATLSSLLVVYLWSG